MASAGEFVTVATYDTAFAAGAALGLLEENGIRAVLIGGVIATEPACGGTPTGGVTLRVDSGDAARALVILRVHQDAAGEDAAGPDAAGPDAAGPDAAGEEEGVGDGCIACGAAIPEYLDRCPACGWSYS